MRNTTNRSRVSMVMAIALGFLGMTFSTPAPAADSIAVVGTSVNGGNVNVTVRNMSLLPRMATVTVEAVVNGSTTSRTATVLVLPFQSATASAGFAGSVSNVLRVNASADIADEGLPF